MFRKPGKKIKILANIAFWLMFLVASAAGVYAIMKEEYVIGAAIIIAGFVAAWFVCIGTYAFGTLVQSAEDASNHLSRIEYKLTAMAAHAPTPAPMARPVPAPAPVAAPAPAPVPEEAPAVEEAPAPAPAAPAPKFCIACGAALEPNAAFCRKCGKQQ